MPDRAFIPAPLIDAQPRVFKSYRGRQMKGIAAAVIGAGLGIWLIGVSEPPGLFAAFLLALPGFAYGYYRPNGQPVEYWLRVLVRYHLAPRRLSAARPRGLLRRLELKPRLRAARYLLGRSLQRVYRKGVRVHG